MCRWVVYYGKKVLLADVVTRPENSIVHQSQHDPYLPGITGSKEELDKRNNRINGDGFGVAWFGFREPAPEELDKENNDKEDVEILSPCVFTSVRPSWNDRNIGRLALHIRSHCIFSHVRAASPGSLIVENNCHPFQFGRLLFMHNGGIAHFPEIKFDIIAATAKTTASFIQGTTDSEYAGALFVHYLPGHDPRRPHTGRVMKKAMFHMMAHLLKLIERREKETGLPHVPSSCNFAVSDGVVVICTRFRDTRPGDQSEPPSLYYSECVKYESSEERMYKWKKASRSLLGKDTGLFVHHADEEDEHQRDMKAEVESIIVASEPIYRSEAAWNLVPANHVLIITPKNDVIMEPIELSTIPEELHLDQSVLSGVLLKGSAEHQQHPCYLSVPHSDDATSDSEKAEIFEEKSKRSRTRHRGGRASISLMVRDHSPTRDASSSQGHHHHETMMVIQEDSQEITITQSKEDMPTATKKHNIETTVYVESSHGKEEKEAQKEEQETKNITNEKENKTSTTTTTVTEETEAKHQDTERPTVSVAEDRKGNFVLAFSLPKGTVGLLVLHVVVMIFLHLFFRGLLCYV